jgi:Cu/Ag efflux protein CusF
MPSQSRTRLFGPIMWREHTAQTRRGIMGPLASWSASFVLSLLVFTGCATAYTPPPLTPRHPAHPEALAAPTLPESNTLAYGPADLPSPQPAISMVHHGAHGTPASEQKGQPAVVGEGKVIAVVPGSSQIVVDHKEIKGFMDAMTMGYRIEPPSLLEGVQAGDTIRFTIDTQQKAIVKIEKMNK